MDCLVEGGESSCKAERNLRMARIASESEISYFRVKATADQSPGLGG